MQEAQRLEAVDPMLAAATWRRCLALLPPQSVEFQQIAARAAALSGAAFGYGGGMVAGPRAEGDPLGGGYMRRRAPQRNETWASALAKTGGSMILSIVVYQMNWGWAFAAGFVLLILIHEMGHVIANWHYGMKQSPPFFIPYMGAVIFLKSDPPNAKAEAVVGIAGPVAGTAGALACYALALYVRDVQKATLLLRLAQFAFIMNLFNMIPCPPLDGGRVAAAITPWLWVPGVAMFLGAIFKLGGGHVDWVTVLLAFWILQSALPRLRQALLRGARGAPYYRIGAPARVAVVVSYVLLTGVLMLMLAASLVVRIR
jgi:Zn-dependent protease